MHLFRLRDLAVFKQIYYSFDIKLTGKAICGFNTYTFTNVYFFSSLPRHPSVVDCITYQSCNFVIAPMYFSFPQIRKK